MTKQRQKNLSTNIQYTQSLPRDSLMKLEVLASEIEVSTGVKTCRTDLVKVSVAQWLERNWDIERKM